MSHVPNKLDVVRQNSDSIFDIDTASTLSSDVGVEVTEERVAAAAASLNDIDMDDICGPGIVDDDRRFGCANDDNVENEISETTDENIELDGICGVVDDEERDGGDTLGRGRNNSRRNSLSSLTSMSDVFSCVNENDVAITKDDEITVLQSKMDDIFCELVEVDGDDDERRYYRLSDSNDGTNNTEGEWTITQVDKDTLAPQLVHQIMESKFDDIFREGLPEVATLKRKHHERNEAKLDTIFYEKNRKRNFKTRYKHYKKTFDDIFSDDPSPHDDDHHRGGRHRSMSQSRSHSSEDDSDRPSTRRTTTTLDLGTFRKWCGRTVNHPRVQGFLVILIVLNAIMLGIGTYDFVTTNPDVEELFETIDFIFLLIFTLECLTNVIHLGCDLFRDGWMVLDLTIIAVSWIFASLQVLRSFRSFRLLRAFRIVRAVRLVTHVKMLRNLVVALTMVVPRMTAIVALMGLMFYVFAVLFTSLFKDMYGKGQVSVDYFGRMDKTLYTLFQIMTLDWANVAREVMVYHNWAWIPFVTFVCASSFTVFNLIIAVICDAVSYLNREDKMKDVSPEVQTKVRKLATEMMFLKQNHDVFHDTMVQVTELLKKRTMYEMNYVKPEAEVHKKSSRWQLASFDGGHH